MTTLSEIEVRRIRDETIRTLIEHLTKNARDPERIGRRVLVMDYKLRQHVSGEKVIQLALRLGVSQPRASQAITDAEETLFELRKLSQLPAPSPVCYTDTVEKH